MPASPAPRHLLSLGLATLLTACGDDGFLTSAVDNSSTGTSADTSSSTATPTTGTPTSSSTDTDSSGSGSATEGSSSGDVDPTTSSTGTTMSVEPVTTTSTSSSTTDDTTSSSTTGDESTSSSTTGDESSSSSTTTGDESSSSTGDDFACDAPPFPDLSAPPQIAGCPQTGESQWCLALTSGAVTAIGLDTQTTCQAAFLLSPDIEIFAVGSLGVVGSDLFTCTSEFDGLVARVLLGTGAVELSSVPCSAVTTWRGHIIVQDTIGPDMLDIYQDWDAVLAAQIAWTFAPPGIFSETLNTRGDTLYAAWHSDNHVDRFDLPCGEPLGPVMLDGFDDWMQGIAVTTDNRLLTFGFSYNGLRSFDADLGTALPDFPNVPLDGVGLACFAQQ